MAHKQGTELQFPVKTRKKPRTIEKKTILIIRDENKAALHKRPDKGLLAGMYEFPNIEGHLSEKEVLKWLKERGLSVLRIEPLTESKHIFTHKEWHMIGYSVRVDELDRGEDLTDFIFVDQREAKEKYPIPSAFSAYLKAFYEKSGFSL